ncbi:MAG: IS5/IS1182 family transposase, partial [Clostridium perfringens]|nr:IS5/IS1182 family transposase [Clostridium perfringens]
MKTLKNNENTTHFHQIDCPINLEIIITKEDSVILLYEITEGLDYSNLYKTYSTIDRNPVIEPKTLFRILVYGY